MAKGIPAGDSADLDFKTEDDGSIRMRQTRRTFLCNTALAAGAAAVGRAANGEPMGTRSVLTTGAAGGATVRQNFQAPAKNYGPIARWWWPGNGVTEAELRREVGVLDKAGFGGAEIQAFDKGLPAQYISEAEQQAINGFATTSFFQHVAAAVDEARGRGLFIDYTFGSGWPFGGGEAITPELCSVELRSSHTSVEGPAKLHQRMQIPAIGDGDPLHGADVLKGWPEGWAERFKKRTKVAAVVAVRGEDAQWEYHAAGGPRQSVVKPGQLERGTSVDLTSQLQPDGTLEWDVPAGTWQIFVFCCVPTMQHLNGAAGAGPQLVMDHLSAEAFAAHAKRVGDNAVPYLGQYFGDGMRAIFCDSLEVGANLFWSDDFLAEFKRRRGYDLLPYLPVLKIQTYEEPFGVAIDIPHYEMEGIGAQVREDYRQTVSDLMTERFYAQFNKWAHDHKLLSRTQAHGSPTDVLRVYGESDIPETEQLFWGGGYDFLKMAASAANVYGRSIVGSESFVWPQGLYQTTPEKVKLAADELFTAGVNAIVFHGFPYVVSQIPAPGWDPFNGYGEGNYSSQFNELNPLWPYYAEINGYIARMQYISQTGKNVAAVALYRNDLVHGADEAPPAPKLNQALMDAGYNYDHINADSLRHCTVEGRELVTAGGARYRALVFPRTKRIDAALAEKLAGFARAGLPMVFEDELPSGDDGFFEDAQRTERVQAAMRRMQSLSNVRLGAGIEQVVGALQKDVRPNLKFQGKPLPFIQKRIGGLDTFFLRNPGDAAQQLDAEFEAKGAAELWDPWTGRAEAIATSRQGEWARVSLELQPYSSALIVFDPGGNERAAGAAEKPRRVKRSEAVGASGWKLAATGLCASEKSGEIQRDLPVLIDWSLDEELRGFSGRGVYTTRFSVASVEPGNRIVLDLGNVKNVAEVKVNGKAAGTLLLHPYRVDVTELVRAGENDLEIAVTNALFNYMMMREPRTFRPGPTENPLGLMSAGLIGPVQIQMME